MTCLASCNREQDVLTVLRQASHPALRKVTCRITEHRLVLRGRVPSFYLKQLAQGLLMRQFGSSLRVENELIVCWDTGVAGPVDEK